MSERNGDALSREGIWRRNDKSVRKTAIVGGREKVIHIQCFSIFIGIGIIALLSKHWPLQLINIPSRLSSALGIPGSKRYW